jgi:DNA polymerase III subunit epsilon
MSLDFTAIDFETANSQRGSACAVGLVRVRDGRVVDKSGGLIRPPKGLGEFADYKTPLHGITAEMMASAPTWRKVAAWIVQYTGPDILICHNAGFNIGVLRHACTADDVPSPTVDFLCTMVLARRAFRLPSYRLPFVAAECNVELTGRHQVLINAPGRGSGHGRPGTPAPGQHARRPGGRARHPRGPPGTRPLCPVRETRPQGQRPRPPGRPRR